MFDAHAVDWIVKPQYRTPKKHYQQLNDQRSTLYILYSLYLMVGLTSIFASSGLSHSRSNEWRSIVIKRMAFR